MTRDALTGLYNRGYFDEALPRAVAQAERYQHPLSVLLVDTDHFKEINDTHSHLVGDRVLKLVAELLAEHARAADLPTRPDSIRRGRSGLPHCTDRVKRKLSTATMASSASAARPNVNQT